MRCFIAAWPDEPTRLALSSVSDDVRQHVEHRRVSRPDDLHLTLAFIGDLAEDVGFDLADATAKLSFSPFTLQLDTLGFFPEAGVVWIGTHKTPQPLADLADRARALLDQMSVGYDRRPLKPHLTLLRGVKGFATQKIAPTLWRIASIALYRSTPAPRVPRYARVERQGVSYRDINGQMPRRTTLAGPSRDPQPEGARSNAIREPTAIQVIERMMALLDALSAHSDPVSLKHLARATGLHPSTAHRILNDLVIGRYVDRAETPGSYRLGMRLLELGNLVKARLSVREAALEPMRELHKRTGQTVNLSVRQGDEIVYVDRSYSERSGMQVVRAIGGRAPLHLTSSGKLFLALDDPRLIRAYATRTGLAGHTRNSLTEVGKLERELSMVRTRGYARDNEELEVGVRCIAAGIRDDSGRLVAGLSVSAPAERMQDDWIADLLQTAGKISAGLGFVNQPGEASPG